MTLQELGTIMQFGAEVKMLILNNNFRHGAPVAGALPFKKVFFRRYSKPRLCNHRKRLGITGRSVNARKELKAALKEMLDHKGSYLLEVMVGKENNVFPMVPQGCSVSEIRL